MIRIFLGNPGSGKTACIVREMCNSPTTYFSNIKTKGITNNTLINKDMIIKKQLDYVKKNGRKIYKEKLNVDFWKGRFKKQGSLNVVIDEVHTIMNARRSTSRTNVILTDFLSMIRRVVGGKDTSSGDLTIISQLDRRIDVVAREMARNIRYFRCHYIKECSRCGFRIREHNDTPEPVKFCPICSKDTLKKHSHMIEIWHFQDMDSFTLFNERGTRSYHAHYLIKDISDYFENYDTLQWENMITEV